MRAVSRYTLRASMAGLLAMGLLSGGAGTYASWSDTESLNAHVSAGELALDPGVTAMTISRAGSDGVRTEFPITDSTPLVAGDTLAIQTHVTVRAQGSDLAATLSLDIDGLFADAESQRLAEELRSEMKVVVSAVKQSVSVPIQPVSGEEFAWEVTDAHHGAVITATITTDLPAVKAPGGASWGTELQGQTAAGTLRWSLTQDV